MQVAPGEDEDAGEPRHKDSQASGNTNEKKQPENENKAADAEKEMDRKVQEKRAQADTKPEGTAANASKESALTCRTNMDRLDKGPDNWRAIIGSGTPYEDPDFVPGPDALYWMQHLRPGSADAVKSYQ